MRICRTPQDIAAGAIVHPARHIPLGWVSSVAEVARELINEFPRLLRQVQLDLLASRSPLGHVDGLKYGTHDDRDDSQNDHHFDQREAAVRIRPAVLLLSVASVSHRFHFPT